MTSNLVLNKSRVYNESGLMKILVTGATGFLGSHVASRLRDEGHLVVAQGQNQEALKALKERGFDVMAGDLSQSLTFDLAGRPDFDGVVHAAAKSNPWGQREDFLNANFVGSQKLFEWIERGPIKKAVHISTPSVYTDRSHLFVPRTNLSESDPVAVTPVNAYAETKLLAERWILERLATNKHATVVLRPRAIMGKGDRAILPRILAAAQAGRLIQIGDGRNQLDLTHISDAVEAVVLALNQAERLSGMIFNITGPEPVELWPFLREYLTRKNLKLKSGSIPVPVADALARVLERAAQITGLFEPTLTRFGVAMLGVTQTLNSSLARQSLGYKALFDRDKILASLE
jgi:nucleoside-diphosphate-sugar epimerase